MVVWVTEKKTILRHKILFRIISNYLPERLQLFVISPFIKHDYMKFKPGDKVNFLNESGGGTVTAIIDSRMVKVEVEGGFEMPVMESDLILDYRAREAEEITNTFAVRQNKTAEPVNEQEREPERVSQISPYFEVKEEKGIYLAYEPHDQQWLLTGDLDIFLINNTIYDILNSLFMEQKEGLTGVDYGSVPPDSKINIETIERDELENYSRGFVQILFHADTPSKLYMPLHSRINVKAGRFYKEGSYTSNTLVQGKALIVNITPESALETVTENPLREKSGYQSKNSAAETVKEKPLIEKHKTDINTAIVDLHIGELVDNILGLSSHDMLNIQIEYFKKALNSAVVNDFEKVTFIHGVGNGVLKNAIIKELENYEGVENRMASISKFGVGALDVLIKTKE
jgi:hypothetical protein